MLIESRVVADFHSIEVDNDIDLYLSQDTLFKLEVEAGENLIDKIQTKVEGGVLNISNENKCNWSRSFKNEFKVYLTLKELKSISCFGVGEVRTQGSIDCDTLNIDLWSSYSDLYLNVTAKSGLVKNHTGPGDCTISGVTEELYAYSTGNGFIFADQLQSNVTSAISGGTGELYVYAKDSLFARIDYIGNVYYAGNPTSISLNGSGDGRLIPLD